MNAENKIGDLAYVIPIVPVIFKICGINKSVIKMKFKNSMNRFVKPVCVIGISLNLITINGSNFST